MAGVLTKITYPTLGHTTYNYELNECGDINGTSVASSALKESNPVIWGYPIAEGQSRDTTFTLSQPTAINFHLHVVVEGNNNVAYPQNLPTLDLRYSNGK